MTVQRAVKISSSALTQVVVSQHDGSVMETMIVETCLMNATAVRYTSVIFIVLTYKREMKTNKVKKYVATRYAIIGNETIKTILLTPLLSLHFFAYIFYSV